MSVGLVLICAKKYVVSLPDYFQLIKLPMGRNDGEVPKIYLVSNWLCDLFGLALTIKAKFIFSTHIEQPC